MSDEPTPSVDICIDGLCRVVVTGNTARDTIASVYSVAVRALNAALKAAGTPTATAARQGRRTGSTVNGFIVEHAPDAITVDADPHRAGWLGQHRPPVGFTSEAS